MRNDIIVCACIMILNTSSYCQSTKMEEFQLKNVFTEQQVSLKDFMDKQVLVVIFTSTYCPYSKNYEERIQKLSRAYSPKGVQFLLVNPNGTDMLKEEGYDEMIKRAKEKSYEFPYLADEGQRLSAHLGATKTPEVFVFDKSNNSFDLKYKGAIDDNPQVEADVHQYFLKEAIEASLNKETINFSSNRAMGCMIKSKGR